MNILPLPYPDEAIYSIIARAGIHHGITSPKELLAEIFGNRMVTATFDLPNHLGKIATYYSPSLGLDIESIAYKHTLLPLYAPFITEEHRAVCLDAMKGMSQGTAHLVSGVVASKLKQPRYLRYCPKCLSNQLKLYGEYYWCRLWQVAGIDECPYHGSLIESEAERHPRKKHEYQAASPNSCPAPMQQKTCSASLAIYQQVDILLNLPPKASPSLAQWSTYYKGLARLNDACKEKQICHQVIYDKVMETWSTEWLKQHNLSISNEDTCWLRSLFRKHRKAFSYLEHLVAMHALLPKGWGIDSVLYHVRTLKPPKAKEQTPQLKPGAPHKTTSQRKLWLALAKQYGVKRARCNGGGATYAWLYRHDRAWLLSMNQTLQQEKRVTNNRVNWLSRDKKLVKHLIHLRNDTESDLHMPRRSRNWYLQQLSTPASIEQNLQKMPLTRLFFDHFCEDIEEYQIRRITLTCAQLNTSKPLKYWKLLREAGLSQERLKVLTSLFIKEVVSEHAGYSIQATGRRHKNSGHWPSV